MTLDYKKPDFAMMPEFMRKQVRFSSLESTNLQLAVKLFEKTFEMLRPVFTITLH